MKAILSFILLSAAYGFGLVMIQVAPAYADDDDLGPVVHETLELYASDAADVCVHGKTQIRVTVNGVKKKGIMKLELYGGDDGFLSKKGRMRSIRVPAENAPQLICVDVPAAGTYAIASYHDRDGNRKLKKKWNFTPREPYALSNNPEIAELRMPKFTEAAFDVSVIGTDITLNLVDLKALKKQKKAERDAEKDDDEDEDDN